MSVDWGGVSFARRDFLYRCVADECVGVLGYVTRHFTRALLFGCPDGYMRAGLAAKGMKVVFADPGFAIAREMKGVQAAEDALPFADASFDLIIACGTLESVNALPGAPILIRRILRHDGLCLAGFSGAARGRGVRRA